MDKLPLNKTQPKDKESLYSFLHRLALVNYYEHFSAMFTELRDASFAENCNEIHPHLKWVGFVSSLLERMGIDINSLVVNQYDQLLVRKTRMESSVKRRDYYRKYYHRYSTKYCPECLKEDFYHRNYWDISYVTVCTKHKASLITHCTKCKCTVLMSRLLSDKCKCGKKYTKIKVRKPDPLTLQAQTSFQHLLFGEKKKIKRANSSYISGDEYLDFLFFFRRVIENLKVSSFFFSDFYGIKNKLMFSEKEFMHINRSNLNFIVSTLHFLITDPAKDLENLINSLDGTKKRRDAGNYAYNERYHALRRIFKTEKGLYYYEIYTDILNHKKDENINHRKILPPLTKDKAFITLDEAAKLLNSKLYTVKNLCKHNLIKEHVTCKNGKRITVVEKESVNEYLKIKRSSFTLYQGMKYLGLNYQHLIELINVKLIKPIHGKSVDGHRIWYIPKKEVFCFEKELKEKLLPISSIKEEWWDIRQVSSSLRQYQISIGEIYLLIFNGSFRVYHDKNKKLTVGLKILKQDVERFLKELYYKRISEKGYRGRELERACKATPKKIKQLLDNEILQISSAVKSGKYPPQNYVDKQQVIEYLKNYKGMNEISIEKHLRAVEVAFEPPI
ncbi:TniQ family protein [Pseudobacillus wudalianchiensis]|uniref:TniQ domain-containing protein n=1 Tax=Pseudobacillus wudalianchiensis TaxID=1743143 RepID=A0A1B9B920_9BACI|nr:TniQ family protein [Bacillus wudalianchiensis]OCA92596.1 hypothetical protein A8F95_02555 [Bacillus wudalianchiensis]